MIEIAGYDQQEKIEASLRSLSKKMKLNGDETYDNNPLVKSRAHSKRPSKADFDRLDEESKPAEQVVTQVNVQVSQVSNAELDDTVILNGTRAENSITKYLEVTVTSVVEPTSKIQSHASSQNEEVKKENDPTAQFE